jgi:hypothetical protein
MAAYDIDTLANVKVYLGITDATVDTLLQTLISNVSLGMEGMIDRKIVVQTVMDEILNGDGTRRIYPRYTPIYGSATSSHWESDLFYRDSISGSWTAIETDNANVIIRTDEPSFIELYDVVWPLSQDFCNVKISYKAGFNPVPGDLMICFYEMVQQAYAECRAGNNKLGIQSSAETRSNITSTFRDLRPRWKDILLSYRKLC